MSAKWRKIIWVLLALQLYVLHGYFISKLYGLYQLAYRVVRHFGLPYALSQYFIEICVVLWLIIGSAILGVKLLGYYRFRNLCYREMTMVEDKALQEQLQAVQGEKQKKFFTSVYQNKRVGTPFVLGFQKPILILPKRDYESHSFSLIFKHEYQHIEAHDNWYKLFLMITRCLLWYQPLAYLLCYLGFMDVEIACDEAVVGKEEMPVRTEYAQTLLDTLKWKSEDKNAIWSSYFNNSTSIMKARIKAIMDKERKWNWLAYLTILVLILETLFLGKNVFTFFRNRYQDANAIENIYEGYTLPESFTDSAKESMLAVRPLRTEVTDYAYMQEEGYYEDIDYKDIKTEAVGPWQVRINGSWYHYCIDKLLTRYLWYFENQELGSRYDLEDNSYYSKLEIVTSELLSGNVEESVYYIIGREVVFEKETGSDFTKEHGIFSTVNGTDYVYYCLGVHIKKVDDYVFELVGITDGAKLLEEFQERYPEEEYGYQKIAKLQLWNQETLNQEVFNQETEETKESITEKVSIDYRMVNGCLEVTKDGEIWLEAPITLEELYNRGDQMDGVLTKLQDKSFQADEKKVIFSYCSVEGKPGVIYLDENNNWKKSIVTEKYPMLRRSFVSFPEEAMTGYMVLTTERVMWQEGSVLFLTKNGGQTWQEIGTAGPDVMTQGHSLTTGAEFVTNQVGFLTIRDSETPDIWRTENCGKTWEKLELPNVPEYYCMAYPPTLQTDGSLHLYVGMEEYSEYGGNKAFFISYDFGESWEYQGLVLRQ